MAVNVSVMPQAVAYGLSGVPEIIQNVRTLFSTRAGTVPLDREFGIDLSLIDDPMPAARARLRVEMIQKLKRYEPRARISKFGEDFQGLDGRLHLSVSLQMSLGEDGLNG